MFSLAMALAGFVMVFSRLFTTHIYRHGRTKTDRQRHRVTDAMGCSGGSSKGTRHFDYAVRARALRRYWH